MNKNKVGLAKLGKSVPLTSTKMKKNGPSVNCANSRNFAYAQWLEVVDEHADSVATRFADGSPWRTFAGMHAWIREKSLEWSSTFSLCARGAGEQERIVCSFETPIHPSAPAAIMALWYQNAAILLLPSTSPEKCEQIEKTAGAALRLRGDQSGNWKLERLPHAPVNLPRDTELLKVTSGSSGSPRLVAFTTRQLFADSSQILEAMKITPGDLNLAGIPFTHSYGFSNLVTTLLFGGVPLACAPDLLPHALARTLENTKATVWPTVPAIFPHLVAAGFSGTRSLRRVISAGARLPAKSARDFHHATGLRIHSFYGSSECGGICFDSGGVAMEIDGWVGTPMPAADIREIPNGDQTISLEIRGGAVGLGCIPETPSDALNGGVFRPSDLLEPRDGGYRLVGRIDDIANLAGRKVHPAEIEAALCRIPGISAAVVCGIPGRNGDELLAVLETSSPLDTQSVRRIAADFLPGWQVPRHWEFVQSLPVNERGKINRRAIAEGWAGGARAATGTTPQPLA